MMRMMCDICGRDMTSIANLTDGRKYAYCVTVYGKQLDMCKECRYALYEWIEKRKKEGEEE